jgi:hypothetical protein
MAKIYGITDLAVIINGILKKQDLIYQEIKDAIYLGEFLYVETDEKSDTLKTIVAKRKIYSKGYDKQKSECLEMIIEGQSVNNKDIEKQVRKNWYEEKTCFPFDKKYVNQYDFSFVKEESIKGTKVWVVSFMPKSKGKGYIQGQAKISQIDFGVVELSFVPINLPFILKDFKITLDYEKFNNYWLPKQFLLTAQVDIKILVSLVRKFIVIMEVYSDYKFNNGLDDSFFK